jgi:iron complex outermembrane recepter protein
MFVDHLTFGRSETVHTCRARRGRSVAVAAGLAMTLPALALADAPAADDAPAATSGLEEIVVTASRHEESEQKESRAISVLTGADLQRDGVSSAQSLNTLVPGLEIANSGPQLQIFVRGVGDRTVTAQTDPAVAFNYDGIYLPRAWEGSLMFFDLSRVELLKGPQGTLYGRNSSAGALNVLPAVPTLDKVDGYFEADGGNYAERRFAGAINVPLNDWIAMRASFQTENHDGYLSDGDNDADSRAFRYQVLLQPSDNFSTRLNFTYTHNGGHGEEPVTLPLVDPSNPWLAQSNSITNSKLVGPPFFLPPLLANSSQDVTTWFASANLQWTFAGMTLTAIPAYVDGDEETLTYAGFIPTPEHMKSKQSSLEVRLSSSDKNSPVIPGLQWVAGAFFSHEQLSEINFSEEGAVLGNLVTSIPMLNDTSWAAFGEGKYSITDAFRLIGGVRYTSEEKVANGSTTSDPAGSLAFPTAATDCFNSMVIGQLPCEDVTKHFHATNWRGGLEYDLTRSSMAYFTASTGFKAGGFYAAPPPNTYEPETLTAYELGIKNRFFDDRLQANIELFYWDYKDLQEQILAVLSDGGIGLVTRNAAQATLKGVDASFAALITQQDKLSAEVEYNHARYNSYVSDTVFLGPVTPQTTGCIPGTDAKTGSAQIDCSGMQLVKAPTWSGAVSYEHTFPLPNGSTLVFNAQEHFSSSYWLADDFTAEERAPSWALTNLILTYNFAAPSLSVSAYVNNLENKAVYNYAVQSPAVAGAAATDISPPRTYGVRLHYDF